MQYCPFAGIMVTQNIDEARIDFDSSRYHPLAEQTKQILDDEDFKDNLKLDLAFINDGHIKCYFSTPTIGPVIANTGASRLANYIYRCATAVCATAGP